MTDAIEEPIAVEEQTEVRECTWQTCHEPAIEGSPYCSKHADVVTPEKIRMLIEQANADPLAQKIRAEIAQRRATATARGDARSARRKTAAKARAAGAAAAKRGKSRRKHGGKR